MSASIANAQHRHDRFLMAEVSVSGREGVHQIRVRNLSAGGMMGEGDVSVDRGTQLVILLPNIGSVTGSVAWVQDDRFGVAFAEDINPDAVFGRSNVDCDDGNPKTGGVALERRSETRLR